MKRLGRLLGILSLALILMPAPVLAGGLVMSIDNVTGPAGGLGTFEVFLTNTDLSGGQSFDVASFSFQLMLPSAFGVQFTGASTATVAATYIFEGTGGASVDPTFTLSLDSFPNTTFTGSDTEFTFPSITVGPGGVFGLGLVSYSVLPSAPPGDVPISFVSDGTSLSDAADALIGFQTDVAQGIIHVSGSAVPEPSSLLLVFIGLGTVLAGLKRRHRLEPYKKRGIVPPGLRTSVRRCSGSPAAEPL
jgi:PEP-CTERM motif